MNESNREEDSVETVKPSRVVEEGQRPMADEQMPGRETTVEREDEEMIADELDEGMPETAASAPLPPARAASPVPFIQPTPKASTTPKKPPVVVESTTPLYSPPKTLPKLVFGQPFAAPFTQPAREEQRPAGPRPVAAAPAQPAPRSVPIVKAAPPPPAVEHNDSDVDELESDEDLPDLPEPQDEDDDKTDTEEEADDDAEEVGDMPAKKMFNSNPDGQVS
jgi:hypothetical protein